ncbi:MAG TPA: hypothetical protein VFA50_04405 [Stellaceae bacterium]|nr:hypothetical protein [Stellaceae bacterium]
MRLVSALALAMLVCSLPVFAASPDDLAKLSDGQLGAVSGGQAIVDTQGVPVVSFEKNDPEPGSFDFFPPAARALAGPNGAGSASSGAGLGLMPIMGNLVGSSSFAKYGH